MKYTITAVGLVWCCLVAPLVHATERGGASQFVEMRGMMVPVSPNRFERRAQEGMVVVMEVDEELTAREVCRMAPRLYDAIIVDLYRHPLIREKGKPYREILDIAGKRLTPIANSVLPTQWISGMEIIPLKNVRKRIGDMKTDGTKILKCR